MTTFTEVLPAQKASEHNAVEWTPGDLPGDGMLVITTARAVATYTLREFATKWSGRAFRLEVVRGGTDPESESYDVFLSADPRTCRCCCKGFTFGRGKPCKHLLAVQALVENRWI